MDISIIGGGITGLTTALALCKFGIDSKVYERAPVLSEVGAGIWIQPNGLKVLDWLGLGDDIRANGVRLHRPDITDQNLKSLRKTKSDLSSDKDGSQIIAIHRGRLQKVLYEALGEHIVVFDREFRGLEILDNGLAINFKNGNVKTDLVLGADGIHSKVRQQVIPYSQLRYSGQTSWRGIATMSLPAKLATSGREAWGAGVRFGLSPISDTEVYWFAVTKAPSGGQEDPARVKDKLHKLFRDFAPIVHDLIDNTDGSKMIRADIHDLKRLPVWHEGNVCLMGDAAHATTPNMGQGGCQGIEDAYFMARCMSANNDPKMAFTLFENKRRQKVDYVVNNSWNFGRMVHNPFGRPLMKLMIKTMPESAMHKQMNKLYEVEGL